MSVLVFNVNGKVHSFLEGLLDGPSEVEPLCPFLVMTKARVRVSHVGGAKNVWLQRTSHDEALTTLVEQMFAYYETEAKGNDVEVTAGVLCAAKSPTDGNWYRARVVSAEGEAINVHFLDYGNGEVVPPACVKALDEMFHLPNLMSVSVALPIILVIPEEELVEKVAELTADKDFVALFSRDGDRLVADLVKDSVSISKQLSESGAVSLLPGYTNMVEEETKAVTAEDKCVVFVSFIESPVEFWVQVASNAAAIEGLQAELQSVAENLWAVKEMPSLGELVAVMFSDDDNWYRGKVMTVDGTSLTVCFVDYGNTEVVDFASSDIKHLPENLKGLPHFATRCKFDLVPPSGSEWGTEALERFENLVADTGGPFVIKTLYEDEVKHVEMLVDNTNFKDVLVSEGLAIQCTPAVAIPERPTPIGSKREQVFVCHGTSPSQFWVRREEDSEKIDSMMSRLSEAEHYPTVDEPLEEKQLVVVRHEDEMWYRASVIVPEEKKVLFVDYGSETCTTDVRLLPLDLAAMPPLARSCSLKLPSSLQEWPITLDAEFEALAAEGTACFEMEVVLEEDPATVIMYLDGKSVADVLLALCEPEIVLPDSVPTSYPEIQLDNAGVCVSYRTSPSEFWLQNASSAEMLAKLGEWLASAEGFPELQDLGEGMFCAAKFEEVNMWFRGRVVGTSDDGISVLFVDYGNTAVCRELRALPANLERVPPLARFCQLLLLPGASGWSPLACETFLDSTTDITKVFQVEVVDDDDPVIVKLSHDGNDIFHGIAVDSLIIPDMGSDDDILELENIKIQIPAECEVTPKLSDEGAEAKQSGAALQETAVLDVRDVHTAGEDDGVSKGPQVVLSIEGEVDASTAMAKSSEGGAIVSSIMSTLVEGEVDSLLESTEESFKEDNLYVSRTQVSEFTVDGTKEAVCKITCNEMPVNVAMPDIQARTLGSEGRSMADECVTKSEIEDVGVNFANSDTLEVDDASELETEDVDINAPNLEKIVLHETEAAIVIACGSEASNIEVGVSKTEHEELNLSAANLKTDFEVNDVKLENLRLGEPVINDEDINSVQLDVSDVEGYVSDLEMEDTKSNTVESGLMGVMEAENITKSVNAESSKCVHNLSADISMDSTDKEMEPKTFSRSETAESSERVCNLSADLSVDPADQKMEAENISKSETAESSERVCNLSVDISVDPTGKEKEPKIVKSETAEASECVHNLLADVVNRADHRSVELSGERDALLEVQCGDALRGSELEEQVAAVVGVNGVRTGNQEIHQATAYSTVKQATGSEAKQRVEETEEDFEDAVEEEQQDGDSSMKKATLSGRQTEHLERIVQDIPVEMKTPSVGSPAHLPRVTAEFKRVPSRPGSPRCDNTERILPGCVSGNSENGS